jgi:hypothetical protein
VSSPLARITRPKVSGREKRRRMAAASIGLRAKTATTNSE